MATISAPRLLVGGRIVGPGAVVVEDGLVVRVEDTVPPPAPDHLALPSGVLTPGLIDLQVNGAFGVDFVASTPDEWRTVAGRLAGTGVTAFLPTFITGAMDTLVAALARAHTTRATLAAEPVARVLGVHLEGPFLSPAKGGTHPKEHLLEPAPELVDRLLGDPAVRGVLALVTLAPELPGGTEAVRRLVEAGIKVSIGHSDATAAEVGAAADAGATLVTHLFNAMRGLGHREPGVVGAALTDPRLTPGLIADLHHVVPAVCSLVLRIAGKRTALVTDAMAAAGMPPGRYRLGDVDVTLAEGDVPRNPDGTIAGSALTLDQAVRNLVALGHGLAEVVTCGSTVPADALGRADLGRIAPGAAADLVWWDDELNVRQTWVAGETVFTAAADTAPAAAAAATLGA
ncbi:N-acetylglucosamine-6-phosphate deacetylase [Yinghuangia seranimata]|uniref:N-acetylglucosamine-6-phosphate deacetylase n=1 Tax=Yinghuangia seranimata TaxID=408067 RepID=UPI00248B4432|nr:N-acetylglucosamine-6-phosphate deacetylase [Yinghuangia seranimata]MDI2128085.1 N-acetylglucosamine-6-phosphate deacetylase [Yinghuangia seranimata]